MWKDGGVGECEKMRLKLEDKRGCMHAFDVSYDIIKKNNDNHFTSL